MPPIGEAPPDQVRGRTSRTANTAFLTAAANPPGGNAKAAEVDATFWIETVAGAHGQPDTLQLQYTQLVQLDFKRLALAGRHRGDAAQAMIPVLVGGVEDMGTDVLQGAELGARVLDIEQIDAQMAHPITH